MSERAPSDPASGLTGIKYFTTFSHSSSDRLSLRLYCFDARRNHKVVDVAARAPLADELLALVLGFMLIRVNPASSSMDCNSSNCAAPAMHPAYWAGSALTSSGNWAMATMSEMASLPPCFKARKASSNTLSFWDERLMTQLEMMTSTAPSSSGRFSIYSRRNSTLLSPAFAALARALCIISGVISTPITRPLSPTALAARKQSPPPLHRSRTFSPGYRAAMACGLPQPRPILALWGTADTSWLE